jgi:hypothetical protein
MIQETTTAGLYEKLGAVVVSFLDVPSFLPPLAFYLSYISPPSSGLIQNGELSRGASSAASLSSLEGIILPKELVAALHFRS